MVHGWCDLLLLESLGCCFIVVGPDCTMDKVYTFSADLRVPSKIKNVKSGTTHKLKYRIQHSESKGSSLICLTLPTLQLVITMYWWGPCALHEHNQHKKWTLSGGVSNTNLPFVLNVQLPMKGTDVFVLLGCRRFANFPNTRIIKNGMG